MRNVLIFLASILASSYVPAVAVLAYDARMRDQLAADLHD